MLLYINGPFCQLQIHFKIFVAKYSMKEEEVKRKKHNPLQDVDKSKHKVLEYTG